MWTAIRNNVYDISEFIHKHPGGSVLRLAAGREATCLFESYHPSAVRSEAVLGTEKVPLIGVVAAPDALPTSALDPAFFATIQHRVQDYLQNHKLPFHFYPIVAYTELICSFLVYTFATLWMIWTGSWIGAAIVGFMTGRLGFLMHSGNHCSTSSANQWGNKFAGYMMDYIGSNSLVWAHEHQVAHHVDPNEIDKDNDASIGYVVIRFHPALEWKWWHKYNHWLTIVGMSFGFFKWVVTDFVSFTDRRIGHVKMCIYQRDWRIMCLFKAFWAVRVIVLPWYMNGFFSMLVTLTILMIVGAHYLENIFIVNHIQDSCVRPPVDGHWARKQVCATANWASASVFWNWFSGGLNHQVEHHLFPSMSTYLYPYIAPIVRQTCQEFGVSYKDYPSFWVAWKSMFDFLRQLGDPNFGVPATHSVASAPAHSTSAATAAAAAVHVAASS